MHVILGTKQKQTSAFLTDGTRVPVTFVSVADTPVVTVKTQDKHGYMAVQLGLGKKKRATKPELGHAKKGANLDYAPKFLAEVRFEKLEDMPAAGDMVSAATVLEAGDIVDVRGKAKGKGFAGGVKRFHFKGGPRTHGQSDRERAPGSIGQTTTPGRVYRGKRMAGKMGNDMVTVKNLEVLDVTDSTVVLKGLVPGITGTNLVITKVNKNKKFVPLFKEEPKVEVQEVAAEEVQTPAVEATPETKTEEVKAPAPATEVKEEVTVEAKSEEQSAESKENVGAAASAESSSELKEEVKE